MRLSFGRRSLTAAALGAVLVATAAAASACGSASPPAPPTARPPGPNECRPDERAAVLREEQADVLARLGRFRVLRNRADIAALAQPPLNYAFVAHQFTSFRGIGLTIINPFDTPRQGVPNLVFYAPSKTAKNTTDPRGPDFPYTLVGWGYGAPYQPGRPPGFMSCLGLKDWHIHERGVHPTDTGGMTIMPPTETLYGEAPGTFTDSPPMKPVVGFPHGRAWTVHLWLEPSGLPVSAIADPHDPPPGIDSGIGSSFFFPEKLPGGPPAGG